MGFGEKWFWATYVRGQNPITAFIMWLIKGVWIPIGLSLVFCLLNDTNFFYFWHVVFYAIFHFFWYYITWLWTHFGEVQHWVRHVLWLDHPEYFNSVPDR